jgi:hypothetical protein
MLNKFWKPKISREDYEKMGMEELAEFEIKN